MTEDRRPRHPTAEEHALWDTVSKSVAPLKRRPEATKADAQQPTPSKKVPKADATMALRKPRTADAPRLAPLDRRLTTRIGKGRVSIDARVDLHGLTQASAHRRLYSFLADSQAAGARLVLVITGKGRTGDEQPLGEERGVLRRLVPIWLASTELRRYVVGYGAAGRGHGGEGALYVRIRSRRNDGG